MTAMSEIVVRRSVARERGVADEHRGDECGSDHGRRECLTSAVDHE